MNCCSSRPIPLMSSALPAVINIMRTVFPIAALKPEAGGLARPDYFGTAFAIRRDLLVTAAHVIEAAASVGVPCVSGPTDEGDERIGAAKIDKFELFPERDFALLF